MAYKDNPYSGAYWFKKLEEKAALVRKVEPTLTKEQAISRAAQENPRLHQAYSDEVREDIGGGA